MYWSMLHPEASPEHLGFIPSFLNEDDPRPAREQIDANYRHGGGWSPFVGFAMTRDVLCYPGDPPMSALAETKLREETIRVYDYSWVAIVQPDGTWEVACLD
jgi:hypothetical protein